KWGGGPLLAVDCGRDVQFAGEESIGVYASSDWAERGFCARCGSHLFYRLKDSGQYMIPVGLFDEIGAPVLDHQVFIDSKPDWYDFANQTENMTGAEVFALYAPKD
ncbi:MAG: GFA family protein, partial [Halobacteria archaeon]|nr:GFA family protein [Halobacteria archaeon]